MSIKDATTNTDLKTLAEDIEKIARAAGGEIMKHYAGTNTYTKDDGSEVTDADHASESLILPALKKLTPHIPIVSEERVAAGEIPDISGGTFWTVDPLDGTKEFINKTGAFVVAIGLISDGAPVMGVIYHPVMDIMYAAYGHGTASMTTTSESRSSLRPQRTNIPGLRILTHAIHSDMERIQDYLSGKIDAPHHIDTKSGILRACQVAEGSADLAVFCTKIRNGRIAWWDVAPGHAILSAAGGYIETFEGQSLTYNATDLMVPPHIAFSPRLKKT